MCSGRPPQYKGTIFKVPTFSEWLVIVADPSLVDDIGKASDAELSSHQAMIQVCAKTALNSRSNV